MSNIDYNTKFVEYVIQMIAFINKNFPLATSPYLWSDYENVAVQIRVSLEHLVTAPCGDISPRRSMKWRNARDVSKSPLTPAAIEKQTFSTIGCQPLRAPKRSLPCLCFVSQF
jgi:hypothetical protein